MSQTAINDDRVLIGEERLLAWLDYERRGDLKRWLAENGIRYRTGRGGKIVVLADDLKAGGNNTEEEVDF